MNRYPEPTRFEPIPRTVADGAVASWVVCGAVIILLTIVAGLAAGGWVGAAVFLAGFAGVLLGHSNVVLDMQGDGYTVDRAKGHDGKNHWRIGVGTGGGIEWM